MTKDASQVRELNQQELPSIPLVSSSSTMVLSSSKAEYFPSSLKEAIMNLENKTLPEDLLLNDGNNNIHFTWKFRYLGAQIMTKLNKDDEIQI